MSDSNRFETLKEEGRSEDGSDTEGSLDQFLVPEEDSEVDSGSLEPTPDILGEGEVGEMANLPWS